MRQLYFIEKYGFWLSLWVLVVFCGSCQKSNESEPKDGLEKVKEAISREAQKIIKETGVPSISIAVVKNDSLIWSKAFGYANVKTKTKATRETVYATGSTVKPFMSMALLQLAANGKLDLDAPINDYLKTPLPAFSQNSKPITLRHLVSHQAGIASSGNFFELWGRNHRKSLQEIQKNLRPVREPETRYEYSNDSFVLAALVLEQVTGQSYETYVTEHILDPLGLGNIGFVAPKPNTLELLAFPYKLAYNQSFPIVQYYAEPYPAGGMTYMSPSQMARFLIALLNNGSYDGKAILPQKTMLELYQTSFGHEYYGLGIGINKTNKDTVLFHSGRQPGYYATFRISLNSKTAVYMAANTEAEIQLSALADLTLNLLVGENTDSHLPSYTVKEYDTIHLSEEQLKLFLGSYIIDHGEARLEILMKSKKLFLKNPSGELLELCPYGQNQFFLKTENEQIEFLFEKGKLQKLILYTNGNKVQATKEQ